MSAGALSEPLARLTSRQDLSGDESEAAVAAVLEGGLPDAQVGALLAAWRTKGETPDELAGTVRALRARMIGLEVPPDCRPLLDTCGTGGDGAGTFNVSTAVAVVTASCGLRVAKHGNRSASSSSGSSDVLTELGVDIAAAPSLLVRCLREVGIAFLFAPRFHPALGHLAAVRRQLPFRTLFNLVGPLANPARPDLQLLGVPRTQLLELMGEAWSRLAPPASSEALVVCGHDGLDEVCLDGPTEAVRVQGDRRGLTRERWTARDFGLEPVAREALRVSGPAESASRIREILDGREGPCRDVVLANSAAALRLAGRVSSLREGVELAARAVDRGDARILLDRWARLSREDAPS